MSVEDEEVLKYTFLPVMWSTCLHLAANTSVKKKYKRHVFVLWQFMLQGDHLANVHCVMLIC